MTTVAELIAHLQTLPQDAQVVIAKDATGNGKFAALNLRAGDPAAGPGWHGQWGWYPTRYREHAGPGAVQAVCLWPAT